MKVTTPYGVGQLRDNMGNGFVSVRLPVNEVTNEIPLDQVITRSDKTGLFKFKESDIEELK